MTKTQITSKRIIEKTFCMDSNQHLVVRGHVGNDLDAEELDLYRFMLGGLLAK